MSDLRTRRTVSGFIEPCQPVLAVQPPPGPDSLHEIKHDGYRLIARRDSAGIRLITRNGHDWADRYGTTSGDTAEGSNVMSSKAKKIVEDGEVVRVPLMMMDALQRSVAMSTAWDVQLVDAFGQPAGFPSGFVYSTGPGQELRDAAREQYVRRTSEAWRAPAQAADPVNPTPQDAYEAYVQRLTIAWQ